MIGKTIEYTGELEIPRYDQEPTGDYAIDKLHVTHEPISLDYMDRAYGLGSPVGHDYIIGTVLATKQECWIWPEAIGPVYQEADKTLPNVDGLIRDFEQDCFESISHFHDILYWKGLGT